MTVTYDYTDRTALITGASSGIGRAAALAYADAGASVALIDVDTAAVTALAEEIERQGRVALALTADVSDEAQIVAALDAAVARFQRIDIAFNAAGIQVPFAGSADEKFDDFERVNGVNYTGTWAAMKHELRQMREQGGGVIVNTSSIGGLMGGPGRAAYHASKHAVIGLTRSAAREFGAQGIRINAICPGTIDTPMVERMVATGALDREASAVLIPLGRLGRPEEIAQAALWLSSDGASFVNGVALTVDGGQLA